MPAVTRTLVVAVPSAAGDVPERAAELLASARALAAAEGAEVVLLSGAFARGESEGRVLAGHADAVHTVAGPALDVPDARAWALAFAAVCDELQPSLVLFGDDGFDRAVAAYMAQRAGAAVVTGVVELRWDGTTATAVRAVLSGSGVETCTVGDGVMPVICLARAAAAPDQQPAAAAIPVVEHRNADDAAARVLDERPSSGPGLRRARTVVAGGAGAGGGEGFAQLRELARLLGAAPAASRGAIVNGWATAAEKVGLTGASVAPDLYIAFGISGASQHMAGCRRSRILVAVNADRSAPIFRYARYGIVADSRAVLDALVARLASWPCGNVEHRPGLRPGGR
jgi:electron transfer flavoprotein alpha subunit